MAKVSKVLITPEKAKTWLENSNFKNRTIKKNNLNRLKEDIKRGKWILDGSTIKFNKAGDVIDGQHRLTAILQVGVPVESFIIEDLEENATRVIDTGAIRKTSDVIHFGGIKMHLIAGRLPVIISRGNLLKVYAQRLGH